MMLPASLEAEFQKDLNTYEEERKMPYITSIERMGMEKGRQEGLREGHQKMMMSLLDAKFGEVPAGVRSRIEALDTELLQELGRALLGWEAIEDLVAWLDGQ